MAWVAAAPWCAGDCLAPTSLWVRPWPRASACRWRYSPPAVDLVGQFEEASETRVHASPPSVAVIAATRHALDLNQKRGDALRRRLLQLVRYFRRSLARCGMSSAGGDFPVQSMDAGSNAAAAGLYQRLLDHGVQAVLHRERAAKHARLSFLFTAAHNPQQIEAAVRALHLIGTRRHRSRNFVPEEA